MDGKTMGELVRQIEADVAAVRGVSPGAASRISGVLSKPGLAAQIAKEHGVSYDAYLQSCAEYLQYLRARHGV